MGFWQSLNDSMVEKSDKRIKEYVYEYRYKDFDQLLIISENSDDYTQSQRQAAKYLLVKNYSDHPRFEEYKLSIYQQAQFSNAYKVEKPPYVPKIQYNPYKDSTDNIDLNIKKANNLWKLNKPSAALVLYDKSITNAINTTNNYNRYENSNQVFLATQNKIALCKAWIDFEKDRKEELSPKIIETYKTSIRYFSEFFNNSYSKYILCDGLANFCEKDLNDIELAKKYWEDTLQIINEIIDDNDTIEAADYGNKGYTLYKLNRYQEALETYEFALEFADSENQHEIFSNWVNSLREKV